MSTDSLAGSAVAAEERRNVFFLKGTPEETSQQEEFLIRMGIATGRTTCRATVSRESDVQHAIQLFWEHQVPGWRSYKDEYIESGLCSREEFLAALRQSP